MNARWAKIEPHVWSADRLRTERRNNRLFMAAVVWIADGQPWRALPERFCNGSPAVRRFRDWPEANVFSRIFDVLSDEPDLEYAMGDATIAKVHRHRQAA